MSKELNFADLMNFVKNNVAIVDVMFRDKDNPKSNFIGLESVVDGIPIVKYDCPFVGCNGKRTFWINKVSGIFYCHKCFENGDVTSLYCSLNKCSPIEAVLKLVAEFKLELSPELLDVYINTAKGIETSNEQS